MKAKEFCIKLSQNISFTEEISALKHSKNLPKNSRILNLNCYIDKQGILRSESRLINFSENDFVSNPIILDANENLARLNIKFYHEKFYHGSHESVVNEIRQKFWIVRLRQGLRSLVSKCIVCKMSRGKPANPKMAALPPARLAYRLRPFTHCGLDYTATQKKKNFLT